MINVLGPKVKRFERKRLRSKKHLRVSSDRPRLVINRTNRYLYTQVIDENGKVLVSFSSISKELGGKKLSNNIESAKAIGTKVAEKLIEKNVKKIVLDRNGLLYHGKIKALADACRAKGIDF